MKIRCEIILASFVVFCFLNGALGQNSTFNCPTVTPKFNMTAMNGTMYVYASIPIILSEDSKCGKFNMTYINGVLTYEYTLINNITGKTNVFLGQALIDPVTGISYLVNNYPFSFVYPYQIAAFTDDFRVTFSCSECGFYGHNGFQFRPIVLTKEKKPDCIVLDEIEKVLNEMNTTMSDLILHSQDDCDY